MTPNASLTNGTTSEAYDPNIQRIYIASPYSGSSDLMHRRWEQTLDVIGELIERYQDHVFYSPILHFHSLAMRRDLPKHYNYWQRVNKSMIVACHQLWYLTLDGWFDSIGLRSEVRFAHYLNHPIREIQLFPLTVRENAGIVTTICK